MRLLQAMVVGSIFACGESGYRERAEFTGSAEAGFGAAVAFWRGEPYIGAPWGERGEVWAGGERVLLGEGRDFLGSSFSADGAWVAAPQRQPGGVVVDQNGAVVLAGQAGENLGTSPIRIDGRAAAIQLRGWRSEAGSFQAPGRLWSLIAIDGGASWAAGLANGGVVVNGRTTVGPGAWGRGLAACDLGEGRGDELVVGDPLSGRVSVHRAGDLAAGSNEPLVTLELGVGAGAPLVCQRNTLWIGAPARSELIVLEDPLGRARQRILKGDGGRFSASIAVDGDQLLVGDPESGVARLFRR